jgi:hypothetical protein
VDQKDASGSGSGERGDHLVMTGFGIVVGIWMLLYGLNVPVRAFLLRRHRMRHDVLQVIEALHERKEQSAFKEWIAPVGVVLSVFFSVRLLSGVGFEQHTEPERFLIGVLLGIFSLSLLWPLYLRSKTRRVEVVLFDRDGVTMFAPRFGKIWEDPFCTRIDWKDCFGYSVFRGQVMFALRPIGHVEQVYGAHRELMEATLNSLGIRKLNAYDVLGRDEVPVEKLKEAERKIEAVARDVAASYCTELASHGIVIEIEMLYAQEGAEGGLQNAHAYLRFSLIEGDKSLHDMDWLVWAQYDDTLELLALPEYQYYEELDSRVQSLVDARMRELGVEQKPTVLQ